MSEIIKCVSNDFEKILKHEGLRFFETESLPNREKSNEILAVVIAPALNEEREIYNFLKSIKTQKTEYPVVVIIADNGSTDHTTQIATYLGANVVIETIQGIGPARQKGLNKLISISFQNEDRVVLIQTDSDSIMSNENYIQSVCKVYERNQYIMASVGPTQFPIKFC